MALETGRAGKTDLDSARLKFLKTTPSETAQCVDILNRIALANPTISFYLSDENRKKVTLNACQGAEYGIRQNFRMKF